jgi:hypothetical protein
MATQILPQERQVEKLKVIELPPQFITQGMLREIVILRQQVEEIEKAVSEREGLIFQALTQGREVEAGIIKAYLKEIPGRRTPQWKEVTKRLADRLHDLDAKHPTGEGYVNLVIENTKPSEATKRLVIEA